MKKVGSDQVTYSQFMYIVVGTMIGTGVLSLPNQMAKTSKQDGWISALVGAAYPLYIALAAAYFSKKYPEDDIISLSKKCFGKFLGSILSLIFTIQFFIGMASVTSGFTNIARVYIVDFLTPIKLISLILLVGLYGTFQGLKIIGRVNELIFYFMIVLLFVPLMAFREGSLLNVSPFLGSGAKKIISGGIEAGFAYSGVEIILLLLPHINDKKNIKTAAIKSVLIIAGIYAYLTFITIYYLGPDIVLKPYWSVMVINETVNLPFINSFRFVFMFLWSLIIFKTVMNLYYGFTYGLSKSTKKLRLQRVCLIIYPVVVYVVYKYGGETARRQLIGKTSPLVTMFNLAYTLLLIIIVHFKKGEK